MVSNVYYSCKKRKRKKLRFFATLSLITPLKRVKGGQRLFIGFDIRIKMSQKKPSWRKGYMI